MKMKTMKRVLLIALALTMLVCVCSACGRKSASADYTWENYVTAEKYFSEKIPQDASVREAFVSAYRGHDVSAEGFDKNSDAAAVKGEVNVEAAKKALEPIADELRAAEDTVSLDRFAEARDALTAEQVETIVTEMKTEVNLDSTGFPGIILVWVGKLLQLITHYVAFDNYVVALFFFAIIVEIVLIYFSILQQKNSIKQARLSPKERAIRKKYAGRTDQATQQKLQQEIQKLYQDEGFNPMSGCLPMLVQMPVVIALYNIVINPLQYVFGRSAELSNALMTFVGTSRAAGGLGMNLSNSRGGTIELLSRLNGFEGWREKFADFAYYSNAAECAADLPEGITSLNFMIGNVNTGLVPSFKEFSWLLLVPVLTFVAYFFSMKVARKLSYQPAAQDPQAGCSNAMMDITMPLMSVFITFITPAAIGIYWIFKCLVGMLEKVILNKIMPLPKFTEEDYKKAEREMKGKMRPEDRAPIEVPVKQKKSLHYIDEEDDLPPRERAVRYDDEEEEDTPSERRLKEAARAEEQRRAQKANLDAAPLKNDRKNDKKK